MIRIPLTFHSPQVIYEFLQRKFGAHNMLVKRGQALVTFHSSDHNDLALKETRAHIVQGQPLRMFKYVDGDLDPRPVGEIPAALSSEMKPESAGAGTSASDTSRMVDEAISVADPADVLEVATKSHFREVIEYVSKFQPLYSTAKGRERELLAAGGAQGERAARELAKFHEGQLGEVKAGVMGLYKKARNHISRFGKEKQRCEIDLQPALQPQTVESAPLYAGKLQCFVHFANKDPSIEVKKLAVLNEKQFVCSNYLTDRERKQATRGRIKVYNLEEEFEVMTTVLPEGAYGLSVIDKYLLVGNLEGSVSFWNASQGPFSSEHPFEITQKLHEGYIFELLKNGASPGGFSVVTLGIDFQIKLFEVSEDLITDDIVTLFFREDASFSQGREIMSIDLMEERTRLVAGSYNKIITYDLPTRKVAGESVQRSNIYRLKRMRESLVAVANTSNLSFADPRANGAVACCPLSQEVKALCVVNENVACYGTSDGELGMVDLRRPVAPYWRDQGTHNSRIYDILRMGDRLVSGDQKGLLVGWNSAEMK